MVLGTPFTRCAEENIRKVYIQIGIFTGNFLLTVIEFEL